MAKLEKDEWASRSTQPKWTPEKRPSKVKAASIILTILHTIHDWSLKVWLYICHQKGPSTASDWHSLEDIPIADTVIGMQSLRPTLLTQNIRDIKYQTCTYSRPGHMRCDGSDQDI